MALFEKNSWVWIVDDEERFLPAKVITPFAKGTPATVQTEDGEERELSASESAQVSECNEEALSSKTEDLVNISDLNEASILHCLRIRFKEDKIYTNISSILISVNPFKMLPIFTPKILEDYRQGYRGKPPHVFGIAYNAVNDMLNEGRDQAVVCSGESGAGKSEATKLILQYITDASSKGESKETAGQPKQNLEQMILAANPILEALGNAKTLRNNNSSRFGKLITVNFDKNAQIIGGNIINYLLEKSRVVQQTQGERNYHIFYQLICAANSNANLQEDLKLQDAELFSYTGQSGVIKVDGISDEKEFEDVKNSMRILSFTDEEKDSIYKIVAGVLHFGNVKFKVEQKSNAEDSCSIVNSDVIAIGAQLWGIDAKNIEKYLTSRNIGSREAILVNYNMAQALDTRDAMTKRVYGDLFQYVVDRINVALSNGGAKRHRFIGVLDIFGFESFAVNSFEQLCINFCNEKLQFHFNEHIFKIEQNLYSAEGITIASSSFVDNKPTLDLLELKATGVFSMIDEEISVPKGSDDSLLSKIFQKHGDGKHPNMIRPKAKDVQNHLKNFGINHYAGPVFYYIAGFLDKNKDQLHPDIIKVLSESKLPLIQKLYPAEAANATSSKGGAKKLTLGGQFKNQLNELITTLNSTFPHFVRCMKSNDQKKGNIFAAGRMQDQLRYAGLVEVCRIRKLGYPVRRPFEEFYKRFKPCDLLASNLDKLLASLVSKKVLKDGEWAKGKTRVFMRTLQAAQLELAREASLVKVTLVIQKYSRRFIFRRRYKHYKEAIAKIKDAIGKREEKVIQDALDGSTDLPFGGGHVQAVKDGKALIARIQEEKRAVKLLESAMASFDIQSLKSAIATANGMKPPYSHPLVSEATALITKLEKEQEARNALKDAIAKRDLAKLTTWIAKAQEIEMVANELPQAVALKARILQENELIELLVKATQASDFDDMNKYISECVELGIPVDRAEVKAAKALVDKIASTQSEKQLEAERKRKQDEAAALKRKQALEEAERKLSEASSSEDKEFINAAIAEALKLGIDTPELQAAQNQLQVVQQQEESTAQLAAAVQVLQVKSEAGMSEEDLEQLTNVITRAENTAQEAGNNEVEALKAELAAAREAMLTFQKQVEIRSTLKIGLATKNRDTLVSAIADAESIDYSCSELEAARDLIRSLDSEVRESRERNNVEQVVEEPRTSYNEAESARKKRQDYAKQPKFDIKYYPGLRTPEEFSRGSMFGKGKLKESFLSFTNNVIPKSLIDYGKNAEANKLAIQMHKQLLGYMGDKQMPYPAMLAQDILTKGYEYKPIRDEIYLQIIKQLAQNPRAESISRGWQMLCMSVGTFPPSREFENYLLHYILEKRDRGRGAISDYARYCLRTLDAILSNGDGSGFVPSVEEILAYKDRPPILASIYLVDGNVITEDLPITPDLNVGKVLEMCTGWLDLRDPRVNTLGMFVYDLGEIDDPRLGESPFANAPYRNLPRTPRPLRNEDYMGDVIVQKARTRRKFKFVLKKKIFLPSQNFKGDDPLYERLVYLQAEDEAIIQGNISFKDMNQVAKMATISMAVAFGDNLGSSPEEIVSMGVLDFISPVYRKKNSAEQWGALCAKYREPLYGMDADQLQEEFLTIARESPDYGTHWFYVIKVDPPPQQPTPPTIRRLPKDITLGFNHEGLHIYDKQRRLLAAYSYADIHRWGGSSSQFQLILADEAVHDSFEFTLITAQASDIAAVILDYVRAIMEEEEGDDGY